MKCDPTPGKEFSVQALYQRSALEDCSCEQRRRRGQANAPEIRGQPDRR